MLASRDTVHCVTNTGSIVRLGGGVGLVCKYVPAAAVCVQPYVSVVQSGNKAADKY